MTKKAGTEIDVHKGDEVWRSSYLYATLLQTISHEILLATFASLQRSGQQARWGVNFSCDCTRMKSCLVERDKQ